jgi:hypothetical protein
LGLFCSTAPSLSEREKEGEAISTNSIIEIVWAYSKPDMEDIMFGFILQHRSLSIGEGDGG